jgi:glycosyltransferase involved in cell wall biosynthesis
MTMPKISVCLPTMNRAVPFAETLKTLARELDSADSELVILDSSSDDSTERLLERMRADLPPVIYLRAPAEGIDLAYIKVAEMARGEYCWFFTDDDGMLPGAYSAVRSALLGDPDCVVLNFENRDVTMSVSLARTFGETAGRRYRADEFSAFAADTLRAGSYVASLVVRRTVWQGKRDDLFVGTEFAHVRRIYHAPFAGSTALVSHRCIAARTGVSCWSERAFQVWLVDWPRLVWRLSAIDETAKQRVIAREPWREPNRLIRIRATGGFHRADYERWMKPQQLS